MNTRLGLAALATMTTVLALFTTTPTPSTAVAPSGDCAVAYPVSSLVAGQPVTGLTVSHGTTPEGFTGEVVGVIAGGIAPGLDMVIVSLTSPEIDRVGGIWQGMSGSPVYAEDGRLIGAVSYGLAAGPSPVAGVTPFADMDDYVVPAARVPVGRAVASAIARATDVTVAQAAQGFAQLPLPGGVSGVRAARIRHTHGRPYLDRNLPSWGVATSSAAGPETIVAGGNLAVTQAYGDVVLGAVGTVTSTCGDRVVGFGHPMSFLGGTTEVMHPADAVYVQEDPVSAPFKVANPGAPAGTITDDHLAGVTGTLGPLPDTLDISSTVTFGARQRVGTTHVAVQGTAPEASYYTVVGNHDRVVDGLIAGTENATWTITGHRADGTPILVELGQQYVSRVDITGAAAWDIPDEMYLLKEFPGVTLDSLTATAVVTADPSTWQLQGVQLRRGGAWLELTPGDTVTATAGRTLVIRLQLANDTDARTLRVPLALPPRLSGTSGKFRVQPGAEVFQLSSLWDAGTLNQFLKLVRGAVRADQAAVWVEALDGRQLVFGSTVESKAIHRVITASHDFSYELTIR